MGNATHFQLPGNIYGAYLLLVALHCFPNHCKSSALLTLAILLLRLCMEPSFLIILVGLDCLLSMEPPAIIFPLFSKACIIVMS